MPSPELPRIRKNSIIIFVSQLAALILNIVSISLAARYLGVEDFGRFNYLLAIVGIGAKILDFGFNPIIFRELSGNSSSCKFVSSALIFRVISLSLSTSLFLLIALIVGMNAVQIILVLVLISNILLSNKFSNVRELLTIPYKVDLKMYLPMILIILDNVLLLVFVLIMPLVGGGILYFTIIYVISNLPGIILLFINLNKNFNFKIYFDFKEVLYLLRESLPLMGYIIFAFIYLQLDILILENISGSKSVGVYASALRLIMPLKIIPNTLVISIFALIVRNINVSNNNEQIVKFVTKIFFFISMSITVFIVHGSEQIILLVFGEKYIQASIPLKILSLGIFFDFFAFFILDLFTAYNKQKHNFHFIVIISLTLLFFNLYFVPLYDFVGSSISRLLSSIIGFMFLLFYLKQKIGISVWFINYKLVAVTSLFIGTSYLLSGQNIFLNFIFSNIILITSLILLKLFSSNEINILVRLIGNEKITNLIFKRIKDK